MRAAGAGRGGPGGHRAGGGRGVEIRIRDWGERVHPDKIKSRDLDDVRPGGLGVHIMSNCMDTVDYAHAEGGGTILTMIRRLRCKE